MSDFSWIKEICDDLNAGDSFLVGWVLGTLYHKGIPKVTLRGASTRIFSDIVTQCKNDTWSLEKFIQIEFEKLEKLLWYGLFILDEEEVEAAIKQLSGAELKLINMPTDEVAKGLPGLEIEKYNIVGYRKLEDGQEDYCIQNRSPNPTIRYLPRSPEFTQCIGFKPVREE
jgi:hypothetical protein